MTSCDISIAVSLLLKARRTGVRLAGLPMPGPFRHLGRRLRHPGPRYPPARRPAGWKVGAATPEADPFRAALTADTLFDGDTRIPASRFNVIGVEAELVYRFNQPFDSATATL